MIEPWLREISSLFVTKYSSKNKELWKRVCLPTAAFRFVNFKKIENKNKAKKSVGRKSKIFSNLTETTGNISLNHYKFENYNLLKRKTKKGKNLRIRKMRKRISISRAEIDNFGFLNFYKKNIQGSKNADGCIKTFLTYSYLLYEFYNSLFRIKDFYQFNKCLYILFGTQRMEDAWITESEDSEW